MRKGAEVYVRGRHSDSELFSSVLFRRPLSVSVPLFDYIIARLLALSSVEC